RAVAAGSGPLRPGRVLRDAGASVRGRSRALHALRARVRVDLLHAARRRPRARRTRAVVESLAAREARTRADAIPVERALGDHVLLARGQCDHDRRHAHDTLAGAMSLRRLAFLQWFGFLAGGTIWFAAFLAGIVLTAIATIVDRTCHQA